MMEVKSRVRQPANMFAREMDEAVAAEQATQVNLVLAEVNHVQDYQRRLGSAQELGAQLKLLFTLFKAHQDGLKNCDKRW